MKSLKIIGLIVVISLCFSCKETLTPEYLKKFAATESYPADSFLDTLTNKRALIIVAHDDDDCAMAGTLVKLKSQGWTITISLL